MALVAAISEATWAFLGVLATQVVLLVAMFVRQGRSGRSIDQINMAVNHQLVGDPTLVQRVTNIEDAIVVAQTHRHWEKSAMVKLAYHVGCILPPYPYHDHDEGGDAA